MFDTIVTMECKACGEDRQADLVVHCPGLCIIDFSPCSHKLTATEHKAVWLNMETGEVDLEETVDGH